MKEIIKTLASIVIAVTAVKTIRRVAKRITIDMSKSYINEDLIRSAKIADLESH